MRFRSPAFGFLLFSCGGATREPSPVPGYTLAANASGAIPVLTPHQVPRADAISTPLWKHVSAVTGWREIFRGKTSGHLFAGSANATVSTRVSNAAVLDALSGEMAWGTLAPGEGVSQLVLSAEDPKRWIAAYVTERRSDVEATLGLVSYALAMPDGTIDESASASCAACHASR